MEQHEYNPSSGAQAEGQLQQISASLHAKAAELKKQISQIQQQSLRAMHEAIDSIFLAQTGPVKEQGKQPAATTPAAPDANPAVTQAVAAATQSVEQAMQAAAQSIANAQNILNGLGQPQHPRVPGK